MAIKKLKLPNSSNEAFNSQNEKKVVQMSNTIKFKI